MSKDNVSLQQHGITPTPVRQLIFRCLEQAHRPLSLANLETLLETVDKSTISRTLAIFKEHHLIHSISDGSGSVKYELCHSEMSDHHDDTHVHFRCEKCDETICLPSLKIPELVLPEGFKQHEATFVITGICPLCNS
ncbi:MAG: transcriptional repressor [Muribaculaceae bacterium]|nr:transcriptional repressor [Muribaculaceae bacterium]